MHAVTRDTNLAAFNGTAGPKGPRKPVRLGEVTYLVDVSPSTGLLMPDGDLSPLCHELFTGEHFSPERQPEQTSGLLSVVVFDADAWWLNLCNADPITVAGGGTNLQSALDLLHADDTWPEQLVIVTDGFLPEFDMGALAAISTVAVITAGGSDEVFSRCSPQIASIDMCNLVDVR